MKRGIIMRKKPRAGELDIILTGFMATGKTSAGKKLAGRLERRFIDTDRLVEAASGMKISVIFEQYGEAYFRDLESKALAGLGQHPPGSLVVATGGGALLREENREILKQRGLLILLTAKPQTIIERAAKTGKRPLLNVPDPEAKVKALLEERQQSYSACDLQVDTTGKSVEQVVTELVSYLTGQ